ncbi:MAG: nucleotidyltransferase family protein [Candidatus Woesearchaeota archaeon]
MLQKSNTFIVLGCFFNRPNKEFELKELCNESDLAHTSVKRILKKLIDKDLVYLKEQQKGKRTYPIYYSNKISDEYKKHKIIHNIQSILGSGLIEFLKNNLTPNSIILFGSYLRGEDDETSDIDLYIQSKSRPINLVKYEKKLKRKIQLHFNNTFESFPSELKNNIINGFLLQGFLEVYE